MNVNMSYPPMPRRRGRVVALHCSGADSRQWADLGEALGGSYELLAPEHYGCASRGPWHGEHTFTLADEAERAIALIDEVDVKVHLVGHSYGGGVALSVALARPDRIASMALYEPSSFHLLGELGRAGAAGFAEIREVAWRMRGSVARGDYRGAVADFVDYWNGAGAWRAMRPEVQKAIIRWAPKGPLEFSALFNERTPASAYSGFAFPMLLLRGQHAPLPTSVIAEGLSALVPDSTLMVIAGAGHMGPLTHASEVSTTMARHITDAALLS